MKILKRNVLQTIIDQTKGYRIPALLTPIITGIEVFIDVCIPYLTAKLIDEGILKSDEDAIKHYSLLMVTLAVVSLCFGIAAGKCSAKAGAGFAANLRSAMFYRIQEFSFLNLDHFSIPSLTTRMTTDVNNLQNAFQMLLRITVRSPFRMIIAIFMCLFINKHVSMIFLTAMFFLATMLWLIISHTSRLFVRMFATYDQVNEYVQENISAIRLVKALVREDYETLRFWGAVRNLYNISNRAERLMASTRPLMTFTSYCCIIALSWFGSHYIVKGYIQPGELASFFTYTMMILTSLLMFSNIIVHITMSWTSAVRISEVITMTPEIPASEHPVLQLPHKGFEFRHVSFSYKAATHNTLTDINLKVNPGERIGLIGATASGKSTLMRLLCRLYEVSEGEVLVGGINVKQYKFSTLRKAVGFVPQESRLFSGTILENLRWGKPDATLEECREVCKIANIDNCILTSFPDGYNTQLSQGGMNLSGGQRQRLCIARTLLLNPQILILDDATSACDIHITRLIHHAIRAHFTDITQVIITQYISNVLNCDRIIVMDQGKIAAMGTHAELLETNDIYRYIYDIQLQQNGALEQTSIQNLA